MFGKKKKESVKSWADNKMNELYNEWSESLTILRERAQQTYIKAEALKVYDLARVDGVHAQKDLESGKYKMLCAIGHYDSIVAEIKRHYAEHQDEMAISWNMYFPTSHEQIESAIRDIFKKNY